MGGWAEGQPVTIFSATIVALSGQASSSGNNTCVTPAAGKSLRIYYLSYNPTSAAQGAFRFGASGGLFLRNSVPANSVIAKEFGTTRFLQAGLNEALILNLDGAVTTNWNVFYEEV